MKHLFRFLTFAGLLLALAGCGKKMVQPQLETLVTDTLLNCGALQYNVQYAFASIANADTDPALKAIEESNIQYFFGLEGFTGSAREAATEALARLQADMVPVEISSHLGESTEHLSSKATVVDTLLVYTITTFTYEAGAAHPMHTFSAHNYSLPGGYELTLADLFTEPQRALLDALIRSKLYDQFGVTSDEGLAEQGFFPEYIGTTENFALTPEGITFYYNPYDIGCYALGDVEVSISKDELENVVK